MAGCQTAEVAYEADAQVSPYTGVPNQYIVKVRVMKMIPGAEPEIIWQPEFLTLKDHLASFSLDGDGRQIKCTALISDEKDDVTATIFVSVKERGKTAKSGRQTVKVGDNPAPGEVEGLGEELHIMMPFVNQLNIREHSAFRKIFFPLTNKI